MRGWLMTDDDQNAHGGCQQLPNSFSKPCTTHELITENDKICIPKCLQNKCAERHHLTLMHPTEQRLELTPLQAQRPHSQRSAATQC